MKLNFTIPLLPLLLAIIFMILKLCGIIAWSWFWIASPIILPIIIAIGFFLLFSLLIIAYQILNEIYIYINQKIQNKK
jgi:hypothetical protein